MAGSKGPAIMLIKGQSQYRQAYLFALGNKDLFGAVNAVIGMASILPKEAKFTIPEVPPEVHKPILEQPDKVKIQKWVLENAPKVEMAVSQYVHKFYKYGSSSL
jgi:hypothetical protein